MIKPDRFTILFTLSIFLLFLSAMIEQDYRYWFMFAGLAVMVLAWITKK
ncbi:MAG: hypothetical protein M0P05_03050 [Candidatus Colwellbacteria bacterium]|jgi:low temperature requirement protein LtrA|nr:hypothetical protein [Candidatus Colwellbacteria bacterium]